MLDDWSNANIDAIKTRTIYYLTLLKKRNVHKITLIYKTLLHTLLRCINGYINYKNYISQDNRFIPLVSSNSDILINPF